MFQMSWASYHPFHVKNLQLIMASYDKVLKDILF